MTESASVAMGLADEQLIWYISYWVGDLSVVPALVRSFSGKSRVCLMWTFVVIKVIGVNLLNLLPRDARQVADVVNDFVRDPVGEGKDEQVCIRVAIHFYYGFY